MLKLMILNREGTKTANVKRQERQVMVFPEDKKDSQRATGVLVSRGFSFLTDENIKGERIFAEGRRRDTYRKKIFVACI